MKAHRSLSFAALTIVLGASGCRSRSSSEPEYPVPFSTVGDRLGVWDGQVYQPVFLKGADLGVAVPGTLPGELAATSDQYRRWFSQMAAMGANVVRVYTLHYPRFYQELARYNVANPQRPLYVFRTCRWSGCPRPELVETARVAWDGWDKVPPTQEREKASFAPVAAAMGRL